MSRPNNKALRKMYEMHHGIKLWLSSDICDAWRRHNPNCVGCKHEPNCSKFSYWMKSIAGGNPPDDFINGPKDF